MIKTIFSKEKGVSIYLTFSIMTIMLAIALGISSILIGQLKTIKGMGDSVIAFYAADAGIERTLFAVRKEGYLPTNGEPCGASFDCPSLSNQASYFISVLRMSPDIVIGSEGSYQDVSRAIEIRY